MGDEKMGSCLDSSNGGELESAVEEEEELVLPGFRFHPTDEELVGFYLRRKVEKKPLSIEIIKQIDIYKYDPWDLPKVSTIGEREWYFFCLRGRKYRNSIRPNRVTRSGFWKATGIDRPINSASNSTECIGLKKSLVYYRGSAGKGTKTDWMMHEFRLPSSGKSTDSAAIQEAEIWTICRIFKRNIGCKKYVCKQIQAADSRSKTSSFDSDAGNVEYKCIGGPTSYIEEKNSQMFAGQKSSLVQAPSTTLHPNNLNTNLSLNESEFYKEGGWDELGRIMDYMMDPTELVYECRYN